MSRAPLNPLWWLKHRWYSLLLFLSLILVLRLAWGWYVHRQVQQALAALRSRGEFTSVSDVIYEKVPDSENVWKLQLRAAAALAPGVNSPLVSNLEYQNYLPFPPAWHQLADASEKANVTPFKLARQSRQLHRAQFRDHLKPLQFNTDHLREARTISNTICDGALYSHLHGNDAEALERLLDVMHLARTLRHDDLVVCQLTSIGIEASACSSAQLMAPALRVDPTTRSKVAQLIEQLTDETDLQAGIVRSLWMERILFKDFEIQFSSNNWFIQPLAERDILRTLRKIDNCIEAAKCSDYADAQLLLYRPPIDVKTTTPMLPFRTTSGRGTVEFPRYSRWFAQEATHWPYLLRHFRRLAERRATVISLAVVLYRHDHQRLPENLQELVPAYLPSIPLDPFQRRQTPFGYTMVKGASGQADRPVIYYDPGGPDLGLTQEPIYGFYGKVSPSNYGMPSVRQYRDLSRFIPPLPKAVNNNPNKPNDLRQDSQPDNGAP